MLPGDDLKSVASDERNDKPVSAPAEQTQSKSESDVFHIDEIDAVYAESMLTMRC